MTLTEAIKEMFSKKASSPAQREVASGAPAANTNPTEAQKRVGNYQKVHLSLDGFRISIENPKGSVRSGTSPDGTKWSNTLACDYGDIRGTEDVDGDPVDIYLSDHPEKGAVFVIDQINPKTGDFDEHKVMYGFDSVEDAKKAYLACYQKGWGGLGWITPVSKAEFRKWIDSSDRKTKPFHEYKSVKPIVDPIKVKAAEATPMMKSASRLYTYLPKDNTAITDGLLSTVLSDKGFEKYRGRTGRYTKEDVLKELDSWEPDWTRSKAISALTEPIPPDAADDFLEFARSHRLYSFDTKDLAKAKILAHIRRARKGGGTDPVDEVGTEHPDWHRDKKNLLFQGVPHYFVETTGGRIPPELVREDKQASAEVKSAEAAHGEDNEDAKKTYLACYQKGWGGLGWITPVSKAEFRKWIDSSDRKTKPFHEYKSVKPIVASIKVAADDIEAKARLHYPADGSHGWNHIQDVLANARRMRRRELLRKELAAIMYHDSSLMTESRETHAEDSAEIARNELSGLFSKRQLADIVNAIAHHRASYEGARNSRLEDLVAAADRPVPNLAKQVARSWKYHEELGEPEDLRASNVASHLKEKYGHGGYAYGNAPKLYLRAYGKVLRDVMSQFDALTPESVASIVSEAEKRADAHHPDIDAVLKAYKDRFGIDLSHVRFKWSRHPRHYDNGKVCSEMPDDETGGSHGKGGIVWINPNMRPVMNKFNVPGKVKDFRRLILAHELAHEIDDATSKVSSPELVKKLVAEAKKNNFRTAYTDTYDPVKMPRKFDKELFAEYMAKLITDAGSITNSAEIKSVEAAPGEDNKECVKDAQYVKWSQFVPMNTQNTRRGMLV